MLVGDIASWQGHFKNLEERMAEAIEVAWPICIAPLLARKGDMTHEDHITNHLVEALIRSKTVPGRIVPQYSLLTDTPTKGVTLSSCIDFVLTIGDDENVYLACECKRLNVPYKTRTKSLVGEYVDDGLMRFITGQYSNGLPLAMMLGYVMDARPDRARRGLGRAFAVRSRTINLKSTTDDHVIPGRPLRFTTMHGCLSGDDISIAHTLLSWP
ncbi:MAG TPA: hypothetical protein VJ323_06495 [Bryobacteraceae bacterium]|jgi:hypothetical protein|nr:hypothetical protein [Bryobacteraceae bacterium]